MEWHAAATRDEVQEEQPKMVRLQNKEIGIFLAGGQFFAVLNFCPHAGAPVCAGRVEGCVTADPVTGAQSYDHDRPVLRCPWHHWEFDLATGQALAPVRQRLRTYPTRTEGNQIFVGLGSREEK